MSKTTLAETCADTARKALRDRAKQDRAELNRKIAIFETLPPCDPPIVCNFNKSSPHEVDAWISFSCPAYDPDGKWNPVELLQGMESMGWEMIPEASLVKWDGWRATIEPSALSEAQNFPHKSRYKFTDGKAVAPYWVTPNQFTKPEFAAFMRSPSGGVYRVSLGIPGAPVFISCRREACGGWGEKDWRFVGPASLKTPEHWPVMEWSRAYVDTQQGISGTVYFHADSAKRKASQALASLLQK